MAIFITSSSLWARCYFYLNGKEIVSFSRFEGEKCQQMCVDQIVKQLKGGKYQDNDVATCVNDGLFNKRCAFVLNGQFTKVFRAKICNMRLSQLTIIKIPPNIVNELKK